MEKIIELTVKLRYTDLCLNKKMTKGDVITLYSNKTYLNKEGQPCDYCERAITLIETNRLKLKSIKTRKNK